MEIDATHIISAIAALVSALLFMFRLVQINNKETKIKLGECEASHKDTSDRLFEINGKVENLMGRKDAAEEMAERVINHLDNHHA